VIHITGRLRLRVSLSHGRTVPSQIMGLVVVAHALPPPTINEVRIDCHMFVTRVNMDLNIIYCENRISDYMDLTPVDIVGKRCYHFIHAEDVEGIRHSHLDCKYSILIKIITLLLQCATGLILIFRSVDLYILSLTLFADKLVITTIFSSVTKGIW
ncbi:hypothetical protein Chor_016766, partial [Crotalus horridus]